MCSWYTHPELEATVQKIWIGMLGILDAWFHICLCLEDIGSQETAILAAASKGDK